MPFFLQALLCLLCLLPFSVQAEPQPLLSHQAPKLLEEAEQSSEAELNFQSKNYPKALHLYHQLALKGKAYAQYQIAYCYLKGLGLSKDEKEAVRWFILAAKQKYAPASFALGLMHYYGQGLSQDLGLAVAEISEASEAKQPSPQAAYMRAYLLASGYGLSRNLPEALSWYAKAAALGHREAQYNLGLLYYTGNHGGMQLTQDYSKAFFYFHKAAAQHLPKAMYMTGLMSQLGQGIVTDKKQALYWYAQAAEAGLDVAQYNLAALFYSGQDLPANVPMALSLLHKAAHSGLPAAEYALGHLLINGIATNRDERAGFALQEKAAHQGYPLAEFALGYYYYKGIGVIQDNRLALNWFSAAAKGGVANAQYMIGLFYQQGIAVNPDPRTAVYWYREAAMQGMENAQLMLGLMYTQGQGVVKDNKIAYAWFEIASSSQNPAFRGSVTKEREVLAKRMGPGELALAKRLALELSSRIKAV